MRTKSIGGMAGIAAAALTPAAEAWALGLADSAGAASSNHSSRGGTDGWIVYPKPWPLMNETTYVTAGSRDANGACMVIDQGGGRLRPGQPGVEVDEIGFNPSKCEYRWRRGNPPAYVSTLRIVRHPDGSLTLDPPAKSARP